MSLGDLPGEYHIVTDDSVPPVVHPPRCVPVALRNQIKEKLDEMVASGILAPATEPTEWVSSMLVIVKPNKLRICLDPRDLNKAIRRERYQVPTVQEVSTRLSQAKKFTVVDAKDGFWQERLDTDSSYKTTFNHSGVTDGRGCQLASLQPLKSGNVQCMSLFKTLKEWK